MPNSLNTAAMGNMMVGPTPGGVGKIGQHLAHAQQMAQRGPGLVVDGRIKAIAHRQRVAEEELRLVGQELAQGRHRPDRLVLALEPKLAGAPVNQPVECEIPAETQRLSRQLRCHAEIVTHRALHIAAADRGEKIRALLPFAQDDKEVFSCRTWLP